MAAWVAWEVVRCQILWPGFVGRRGWSWVHDARYITDAPGRDYQTHIIQEGIQCFGAVQLLLDGGKGSMLT